MASLEYVMAGWLRSKRLTVASVGAGWGCGALRPRPLPCQGRRLGPGDILPGGRRLGRCGGGSSLVYLVPPWALVGAVEL